MHLLRELLMFTLEINVTLVFTYDNISCQLGNNDFKHVFFSRRSKIIIMVHIIRNQGVKR